jgi:hypothetical protein
MESVGWGFFECVCVCVSVVFTLFCCCCCVVFFSFVIHGVAPYPTNQNKTNTPIIIIILPSEFIYIYYMYSNKHDAILEGFLDLIDIQLTPTSLASSSSSSSSSFYKDVKATFCKLDWTLQQRNPSLVPMFRDLQAQSKLCQGTLVTVDLYDIVQKAKLFTEEVMAERNYADPKQQQQVSKNSNYDGLRSIPPTGVVFHQTRCGSTLAANLLAGFAPTLTKVYSESPPPLKAISACSSSSTSTTCNTQAHIQLIQDVFYLMGRTNRPEQPPQHVFYKIQSIGVHSIHAFTQAFPETPWIFLYRDAIEVMQSHLGKDEKAAAVAVAGGGWIGNAAPVCGRNYGRAEQPPMTVAIITSKGRSLQDVTKTEYCAAHLAGLAESAVREMKTSTSSNSNKNKGRFVNYNQLPTIMWESIVPHHFGVDFVAGVVSQDDMEKRMTDIAQVYSKGRGNKANQEWEEDSTKKQTTARTEVIAAAHVFMEDTYTRLEELSQKQQEQQ